MRLAARSRHFDSARTGLRSIVANRTTSLVAVALGFAAHLLKCISLYLIVCEVAPESLTLGQFLAFAPVGFVVEALPLAPGGLGTAHLLFDYLFRAAGVAGGASLFNAYFLTRMLVNLGGGVVWLFQIKETAKKTRCEPAVPDDLRSHEHASRCGGVDPRRGDRGR